jgi:hypothetical protein
MNVETNLDGVDPEYAQSARAELSALRAGLSQHEEMKK